MAPKQLSNQTFLHLLSKASLGGLKVRKVESIFLLLFVHRRRVHKGRGAPEEQIVVDEGGEDGDGRQDRDVLGLVGEGRAADGVPGGAAGRRFGGAALETEVGLVVLGGTQIRVFLEHLQQNLEFLTFKVI